MKTRLYTIMLLLLLSAHQQVSAREPNPISAKANLCFIANAGQVTDQHQHPRKDIDYKLNAPGINIFIGNGELHYQWVKSPDSEGFSGGHANWNLDSKFPLPAKEGDRGRFATSNGELHYQWVKNPSSTEVSADRHDLGGFKDGLADI